MTDLVNPNDKICSNEEIQNRTIYKAKRLISNTTSEQVAERGKFNLIKPSTNTSSSEEVKSSNTSNSWLVKNPFLMSKNERLQMPSKTENINPFKRTNDKENNKNPFLANRESPFRK